MGFSEDSLPKSKSNKSASKQAQRLSFSDLSNPPTPDDLSISLVGSNLYVFSVSELKVITQTFSSNNFLGEGGFGPVHKGYVDEKFRPGLKAQPVAVKVLDLDGAQGHREWLVRISKTSLDFLFYKKTKVISTDSKTKYPVPSGIQLSQLHLEMQLFHDFHKWVNTAEPTHLSHPTQNIFEKFYAKHI